MKIVIGFLLCLLSLSVSAQDAKQILGKWKFEEIYQQEELDSMSLAMMEKMLSGVAFYFKGNGYFNATLQNQSEIGNWRWGKDRKSLMLIPKGGSVKEFKIINLSEDKLTAEFSKIKLVLSRTEPSEEELAGEPMPEVQTVSATSEQLAKKWCLQDKEYCIQLNADGNAIVSMFGMEERATWVFGEGNKSIIVSEGRRIKLWHIHKVSKDELILIAGYSDNKSVFSTTESK